jgi:hypothetical protein
MTMREVIEEMRQVREQNEREAERAEAMDAKELIEQQIAKAVDQLDNALVWIGGIAGRRPEYRVARVVSACASLLRIVQSQQAQIERQDEIIRTLQADVCELIEVHGGSDACQTCGHPIDRHWLFNGCKATDCQCPQFVRGLK